MSARTRVDPDSFSSANNQIQAAIDYAGSSAEVVIHGTTQIPTTVTFQNGTRLVPGDSEATIQAAPGFSGSSMFQSIGRDDIHLGRIFLDGNNRVGLDGISFGASDNLSIEGTRIGNLNSRTNTALNLNSVTNSVFTDVYCHDVGRGVWVRGTSVKVDLTRVKTRRTPAYGISMTGDLTAGLSSYVNVKDCDIAEVANQAWGGTSGPRHGLYSSTGGDGHFENCQWDGNIVVGNFSAFVDDTGNADLIAPYDFGKYSIVSGNISRGGGDVGLALWRSEYVLIANNIVDSAHTVGLALLTDTGSLAIGNVCSNNRQNYSGTLVNPYGGIRVQQDLANGLDPSTRTLLVGNHCYDNQAVATQDYQIVVEAGNECAVSGNWGTGNTAGNILAAGTVTDLNGGLSGVGPIAGTTLDRPTLAAGDAGYEYFDTDLVHPIWWTGTAWVDSNGAAA